MSEEETPVISSSRAPSSSSSSIITLRAPTRAAAGGGTTTTTSSSSSGSNNTFDPPALSWFVGTWHIRHSSLPMWKKYRNVISTLKTIGSDPNPCLDDSLTYQGFSSSQVKTLEGIDTPAGPGAWTWRGKGWLRLISSHWEVLGYGGGDEGEDGEQWVVTYFEKTIFTPAGIDIYSRRKEGLKEETVEAIKQALGRVEAEVVKKLAGQIFEVKV